MKWETLELSEKDKEFFDFQRDAFAKIAEMLGVPVDDLGPHGLWAKSIAIALGMPQEDDSDRWEQECQKARATRDLTCKLPAAIDI
jgi:hypothetical protein